MAYTDYDFYKNKYFGDVVPQESFDKYAEKASDRIDLLTFDRLAEGLPQNERSTIKIKKAVCAAAETLYNIDLIRKSATDSIGLVTDGTTGEVRGKVVKSKSAGSESITYESTGGISDIYSQAAMDKKVEDMLILNTAVSYLSGVTTDKGINLLYAGFS